MSLVLLLSDITNYCLVQGHEDLHLFSSASGTGSGLPRRGMDLFGVNVVKLVGEREPALFFACGHLLSLHRLLHRPVFPHRTALALCHQGFFNCGIYLRPSVGKGLHVADPQGEIRSSQDLLYNKMLLFAILNKISGKTCPEHESGQ